MAIFKDAHAIVMKIEGGYANDPDDLGGETYKGISRKNFPNWKGWALIDLGKTIKKTVPELDEIFETNLPLQGLVLDFYKANFWDEIKLDNINDQKIATELYDTGVNMGIGYSKLFLQESLNLNNNNGNDYPDIEEDKIIGPLTIKYVNEHKRPAELFKTLNIFQGSRYIEICRTNKKMEKFWRSWLSRVTTQYN
jgi:lysozyme family protein